MLLHGLCLPSPTVPRFRHSPRTEGARASAAAPNTSKKAPVSAVLCSCVNGCLYLGGRVAGVARRPAERQGAVPEGPGRGRQVTAPIGLGRRCFRARKALF